MSSSRTLSVTVLTVTAMLGSATAWWWSRSPAEASDTPPSRVRAAALPPSSREGSAEAAAAQVEALRREVEVLRQQNQQLAQRMDSVGAQAPRPAESHPLPPEQAMAREVARREAYFGKLDAAYQQEARDAPWAQQTEALVASALRRESAAGSHLEHLDCRSNLCRIELSHQDGAASGKTVDELTSLPGLRGQFVVQQLAGEQPPRSVLYLAREGKQLPPLGSP